MKTLNLDWEASRIIRGALNTRKRVNDSMIRANGKDTVLKVNENICIALLLAELGEENEKM